MNVTLAILGIIAAPLIAYRVTEPPTMQTPTTPHVAFCQSEDGNVDGSPCLWMDPDTGDLYANDMTPEQLQAVRNYLQVVPR